MGYTKVLAHGVRWHYFAVNLAHYMAPCEPGYVQLPWYSEFLEFAVFLVRGCLFL
jgi:hypothetical protein